MVRWSETADHGNNIQYNQSKVSFVEVIVKFGPNSVHAHLWKITRNYINLRHLLNGLPSGEVASHLVRSVHEYSRSRRRNTLFCCFDALASRTFQSSKIFMCISTFS